MPLSTQCTAVIICIGTHTMIAAQDGHVLIAAQDGHVLIIARRVNQKDVEYEFEYEY